ncbi:MAG TPA: bifunctional NADH-specific enoyl-ACP reductase/trans-2-enoyl-CoA reductase [Lachnoclostridium phytofermentans]|uniref:Trans-2-enoyl-CoA reductase [NADH] n=1 Tax=Lachnoclostridium phytofermentans TaxID=66219 RepID=A0A3D2X8B6_9FIRM|nr:bifunctional NADH-specific enoyl-ACP reductase/trans-2-enoyl-CoA reductase [Lachnoclostridium phytofermentans]
MIVEPKVRGFICTTAHPEGCKESVKRQIEYVKRHDQKEGPKKVLIIGASTGYGLASRISLAYTYGAATLGVMYEKPAKGNRTATPGYYNTEALEAFLHQDGYYGESINGDAFSREVKEMTIAKIKEDLGQVDMVIYSLAAPRRTDEDGVTYSSVLKTTSVPYTNKSLDLRNNQISEVTVPAATEEEELATVKVMGGEDWALWIDALKDAGVLSEGVITIAYSYIGPKLTYPIYYEGTIGKAKEDLYQTSVLLNETLKALEGKAYISVNKALVTQASAAIPVVPLYISILYKIMKEQQLHEGCIEQMDRLFFENLDHLEKKLDEQQRIRMDDYEMLPEVQEKIAKAWDNVTTENLTEYADIKGYWEEFYHMFGFDYDNIDYTKDVVI